jgi:hypothetical protein
MQQQAGEYRGVRFFRSPSQPEVFFFVPAGPGPERDAQGRPTALLVHSPPRSSLQLGSRWEVDGSVLEDLRSRLASDHDLNPNLIDLRPAQFQVDSVALVLGDGEGGFQELQRSRSSNYPPLSAIFQANLNEEQSARAISAFGGHKGYLAVTWRGTLTVPGEDPLQVEQTTDVGEWFKSAAGLEHVIMAAAPHEAPPAAGPVEVTCDFDPSGAPVAAVEIRSSTGVTHLTPPRFAPVRLQAATNERLHVKTSFTRAIPPFESDTEPLTGSALGLQPRHLGLALVTVDATGRRRAGAASLQVRLRYLPLGDGVADETILRFRYGNWTAAWLVISRSPEVNGSLEYSTTEVSADGVGIDQPPVTTDQPNLRL